MCDLVWLCDDSPTIFSGCSFNLMVGVALVLSLVMGDGVDLAGVAVLVLVVTCTLGRFGVSFLRGSPHSPEGRVWFPDGLEA